MFKKAKKFCEEHKKEVIVGGVILTMGACIIIGKSMKKSSNLPQCLDDLISNYDDSAERAILEGFGAVYKEGSEVPFATKEVALKFLEERGKTYKIDILDDITSVIWINE